MSLVITGLMTDIAVALLGGQAGECLLRRRNARMLSTALPMPMPVPTLAEQVGQPGLIAEHLVNRDAPNAAGANPVTKAMSLLAGMVPVRT